MRRLDGFEGRQVKWLRFPRSEEGLSELIETVVVFSSAVEVVETERAVINVGGKALEARKNAGSWRWTMLVEEDV